MNRARNAYPRRAIHEHMALVLCLLMTGCRSATECPPCLEAEVSDVLEIVPGKKLVLRSLHIPVEHYWEVSLAFTEDPDLKGGTEWAIELPPLMQMPAEDSRCARVRVRDDEYVFLVTYWDQRHYMIHLPTGRVEGNTPLSAVVPEARQGGSLLKLDFIGPQVALP